VIAKVSAALADAHLELVQQLVSEPYLNVDETGHPENGNPGVADGAYGVSDARKVFKELGGELNDGAAMALIGRSRLC
jgi:hypothetical protein